MSTVGPEGSETTRSLHLLAGLHWVLMRATGAGQVTGENSPGGIGIGEAKGCSLGTGTEAAYFPRAFSLTNQES